MLELTIESRWTDQFDQFFCGPQPPRSTPVPSARRTIQHLHPPFQREKTLLLFVVNVKFKEVVGQLSIVKRVTRVEPFTEQQITISQELAQQARLTVALA